MKNTIKKTGLLFAVIIMAVMCAVSVSAETFNGKCGENVYWALDKTTGELVISGIGDMWDQEISFPFNVVSKDSIKSVVIENNVTSIGNSAFYYCKNLKKVTIADSVTRIGNDAFYHCSSLADITIPDSVTRIGNSAFDSCSSLADITIPDSVTSLGYGSFFRTAYCKNQDNWTDGLLIMNGWIVGYQTDYIRIPADVKFQEGLFGGGIPSIKYFEVDSNNNFYSSDEYGVLYNKSKTKLLCYPGLSDNPGYVIPDTVEEIEILHSLYLENLVIPKAVKEIADNNVISYCFKNVYIYSDDINLDTAKYLCYINIDQEKYLKVRDEYAKICEDFVAQTFKYFQGVLSEEDWDECYSKVEEIERSFITDECISCGTIHANEGSTAQAYANKLGITFKTLNERNTDSKDTATGVETQYAPHTFDSEVELVVTENGENANVVFGDMFSKFKSYEISFEVDGEKVQPNGKVTVKLPVPAGYNAETIAVYYVYDNGNKTRLNSKVENGFLIFETNHFSEYVIVDESSKIEEPTEPEVPVVPEEPVEPDTPDEPTTPDTPDEPEVPDTPEDTETPESCSCNCHKGGIAGFFWKIANFFNKLFKIKSKQFCACGVAHF